MLNQYKLHLLEINGNETLTQVFLHKHIQAK